MEAGVPPRDLASSSPTVNSIEGIIQRVHYGKREITVVADGKVWRFAIALDCQLRFNDADAILRCFHPLDPITVLFSEENSQAIARALFSWEPRTKQTG